MKQALAFQSALGLSITRRCPISCAHCIVRAGPRRTEEMPLALLRGAIDGYAALGRDCARGVIITGGEPFFSPKLLEFAVAHAHLLGLVPTAVTNAFWARSPNAARAALQRLPNLAMLSVSTDRYHRRHVPLEHVKNAARAARERSIAFTVAVCADSEPERAEIARELEGVVEPDRIRVAATLPAGRAAEVDRIVSEPTQREDVEGPCTGAEFPIVFPDGRAVACMGIVDGLPTAHPLLLGNVNDEPPRWKPSKGFHAFPRSGSAVQSPASPSLIWKPSKGFHAFPRSGSAVQSPASPSRLAALLASAQDNVFLHLLRSLGPESILRELPAECSDTVAEYRQRGFGPCSLCYAMAENERLLARVLCHVSEPEVREKTAYARLHFLGEDHMAAALATDGEAPAESDQRG